MQQSSYNNDIYNENKISIISSDKQKIYKFIRDLLSITNNSSDLLLNNETNRTYKYVDAENAFDMAKIVCKTINNVINPNVYIGPIVTHAATGDSVNENKDIEMIDSHAISIGNPTEQDKMNFFLILNKFLELNNSTNYNLQYLEKYIFTKGNNGNDDGLMYYDLQSDTLKITSFMDVLLCIVYIHAIFIKYFIKSKNQ